MHPYDDCTTTSSDPSLKCLDAFYRAALPAAVRRLRGWRGAASLHGDLVADLRQEVATDFLAHRAALETMSTRERHERWLRLIGRTHYRLRGRDAATTTDGDLDAIAAVVHAAQAPALEGRAREFAEQLLEHGVHLKNGRLNEVITARSIGLSPLQLRRRGERLLAALDLHRDLEFWSRRLVEALLGLAADVLRDRSDVLILGEQRRVRPDPHGRLQRIRRLRDRLRYLPVGTTLRRVLLRYGTRCRDPFDPELALRCALDLAPRSAEVHLWWFELAAARGDARRAARALRAARTADADRVSVVLARARLLELRGRDGAAHALLLRAMRRHGDPRLRLCLERVAGALRAS
ncbi:MAG TPA: hypothetical protein VK081_04225 [Planctomycetota bacterium]|nr:hypothetical protein [Planctomycetota bacterium]